MQGPCCCCCCCCCCLNCCCLNCCCRLNSAQCSQPISGFSAASSATRANPAAAALLASSPHNTSVAEQPVYNLEAEVQEGICTVRCEDSAIEQPDAIRASTYQCNHACMQSRLCLEDFALRLLGKHAG